MSAFNPTRDEVRAAKKLARLCESYALDADRMEQANRAGAWLACDSLARDCSQQAFALSAAVAARSQV